MKSLVHTEELCSRSVPLKQNPSFVSALRTCWQKFAILILKNIRICLAKQDKAGSYMWVTVKIIMMNISTMECVSEIAHLYYRKIPDTKYEDMIDHRSCIHNLSSCEI